jgi:signal peptidase I
MRAPRTPVAFAEAAKDLPRESTLVEYSRSFFPVLAVVFVLRSFLAEPFQIPSSSMVPTLEVGDYILVNKFTYGIRLPVLRTKVIPISEPKRGDVMVFFPPHMNKTYYIKRVIGLPGDVVSYRNKRLYVNGEPVPIRPACDRSRGSQSLSAGHVRTRWQEPPAAGQPAASGQGFYGDGEARTLLHDGRQPRQQLGQPRLGAGRGTRYSRQGLRDLDALGFAVQYPEL